MARKDPKDHLPRSGRPSSFTKETGDLICEYVSSHPYGLQKICAMYDEMPAYDTINKWRRMHPEFGEKYMEARVHQAHLRFDYTIDLLENLPTFTDRDGIERIDGGFMARTRTQVGQINYMNARLVPHLYAEQKPQEDNLSASDTLNKVKQLVADLNKVNESDV